MLFPDYNSKDIKQIAAWLHAIPIGKDDIINNRAVLRVSEIMFFVEKHKKLLHVIDATRTLAKVRVR